jgi:hypothetical protein
MGWFTRTHPLQLPSGRILAPMYSDGYSFGIMAISDDGGYTWTGSEPIIGAAASSRRWSARTMARWSPTCATTVRRPSASI